MKSRVVTLFALLAVAASCSSAKTYELRGQILGINVPKMIRTLTAKVLMGWQESRTESTDMSDLSALFLAR